MMRALATCCLLALALAVAGCGSAPQDSAQEFQGDERTVAAVVEQLETEARDDNPDKICSTILAERLITTLQTQGTNCRTAVKEALRDTDEFDLTVDDVTISGDTATVKVSSGRGDNEKDDTLQLVRDGSSWAISSLGGS